MSPTTDQAVLRDASVLLGSMTREEAQQFAAYFLPTQWPQLEPAWQTGTQAFQSQPQWNGAPPALQPLPSALQAAVQPIATAPVFQQAFPGGSIQMVEIDQLITIQQYVDTAFSDAALAAASRTPQQLAEFCFPQTMAENIGYRSDARSLTFFSLSRNFNVPPPEFRQGTATTPPEIVFRLLHNINWINVTEFQGRYFLHNGYHRVWRLRKEGETHVPAIVFSVPRFSDIVPVPGPGFVSEATVLSNRPPLLAHFFDPVVAPQLQMKSLMMVLRFAADALVLPRVP